MAVTHKWVIYAFDSYDEQGKIMAFGTAEAVDKYCEEQDIEPDLVTTFSSEEHMDAWTYKDAKRHGIVTMINADTLNLKKTYQATIELSVEASSHEEATDIAIEDLRDLLNSDSVILTITEID